ncbi:translocation/assembly module TamB domain-containing protein [Lacimicrobium alkaliphilum]|uniref:DUF490 domain-containing protein n=1 Tax=Lacimicrobium alkaliphilum TaxID=1526571 RepID=A0ABQ1QW58_9ALTE|nr:translocation/assembly module TamB domain-containing protein [Lacimicrobium alkaliphilum]GGD49392.1 DUF490 domain-containing protein [Lacimicrobium alkaliphilum]
MALKSNAKRLLRWTLMILAAIFLLVVLAVYWAGATNSGSQWLLQQAKQQLPTLHYKNVSGSLLSGLTISGLRYKDNSLELSAAQLNMNISARALLLPRIEFQALGARQIKITLASETPVPDNDSSTAFTGTQQIELPDWLPPVRLARLHLEDFSLHSADTTLSWKMLETAARLEKQRFTLSGLRLSDLHVILPTSTEAPESDTWPLASLPHMVAPVNTRVEDLQLNNTLIEQGSNKNAIPQLRLQLSWLDDKLSISELIVQVTDMASISLQSKATLKHPYPLNLTGNVTPAEDLMPSQLEPGNWKVNLSGDLNQLHASLIEDKLLSLTAKANVTDQRLPFVIDWTLRPGKLQALIPHPEQANLTLSDAQGRVEGDMQQQNLSARLGFSGLGFGETQNARLLLNASHTKGNIQITDLKFTDEGTDSALTLRGNIGYSEQLTARLNGEIKHLALNTPLLPYSGEIKGQFAVEGTMRDNHWQGDVQTLELSGTLADTPLSLSAKGRIEQAPDLPIVRNLQLSALALGSRVEISGQIDNQLALQGQWQSNDLSLLLNQLEGQAESTFTLSGKRSSPRVEIEGSFKRLQYAQYQATDTRFSGDYQHGENAELNAQIVAPTINIDSQQLLHASLSLSGTEAQHQLQLNIDGDIQAHIALTGQADLQQQQWMGQLKQLELKALQEHWQLQQETSLTFGQQVLTVDAHCYQGKYSQLCLKQALTLPDTKHIGISADIDYGQWANQTKGNQRLSGKASLDGTVNFPEQGLPQLDISLKSTQGSLKYLTELEQVTLLDWQQGNFTLQSEQQQVSLSGALVKADRQPLLDIRLKVDDISNRTLSGNMQLTPVPLQSFITLVPGLSELTGTLAANISLSGNLQQPRLDGHLNVNNMDLKLTSSQTQIRALNMLTRFNGTALDFNGDFSMGDGSASFSGKSHWDPAKPDWQDALQLEASLKGNGLQILAMPELQAQVSPDINLSFDNTLALSGRVAIDSGTLTLTTLPSSATAVSEDMQLAGEQAKQKQTSLCCDIDLDVEMVRPVAVSGFGFKGQIGGALQARQSVSEDLQLFGNLNVAQGTYKAYGQNLQVKSGRLQFVGPIDNPVVQLRAIRPLRGTNVEAGIQASGPASNIVLELFSDPAMEQSAILSYILRGRPPGADSGDSSSMALVMAANQGIDLTSSSGLTEALNEIPLLSDITLDTETDAVSGDSLATVSGYIGERIYLKYGVGIIEPVNQVTVRFYLMNQLWLEAVSSLERSMDLYYSFEVE